MQGNLRMAKAVLVSAMMVGALALGCGSALGAQSRAPSPKVSEANAKTLREAQEALRDRNYSEAVAKANSVIAGSNKTKDDVYVAYVFLFNVAKAKNDLDGEMKALQGQIDSGYLSPSGQAELYRALAGMAYQKKDYHQAITYGEQLIKDGNANPDVYQWVGQAYYEIKDYKNAVTRAVTLRTRGGSYGHRLLAAQLPVPAADPRSGSPGAGLRDRAAGLTP